MPAGTVTVDQMYVHYQVPVAPGLPVTLIHGCCLTGKTWETTPGWPHGLGRVFRPPRASRPMSIDQAWRGRSAGRSPAINGVRSGKRRRRTNYRPVFSAGHEPAWAIFRFGPEYPQVFPGMQFPLQAQGEFWKQMVPDWPNSLPTPNPTVPALSELAQKLDGTVLISHSQSGIYPFQTAALNRQGIAGDRVDRAGRLPARPATSSPIQGLPILVLFGDYVDLSPRWAPRLKECRDFAAAANAARRQGRAGGAARDRHQGQLAHADAGQEQPGDRRLAGRLARQARREEALARSCFSSNRPWRESTGVHSGVDRLDADGTRVSGQESTNPPIPGSVKNNTPSWSAPLQMALGNHERHGSGAVR